MQLITMNNALSHAPALPDYAAMIEVLLSSMSHSSRRQYERTFNDWRTWCAHSGVHPDEVSAPNAMCYLQSRNLFRATKQARLTHLRRLVQTLHSADTSNLLLETYYAQLKLMRISMEYHDGVTHFTHDDLIGFLQQNGFIVRTNPNPAHKEIGFLCATSAITENIQHQQSPDSV